MSISIIIPTKNEEENIPRLLKSIFNLTTHPQEIIIIDNHSIDKTLQTAKKILTNSTFKLIPYTLITKGPERSIQKNYGAKKAKGSHLLFLDADMEIQPKLLNELLLLSEKKHKAIIIPERSIGHDFWGKATALERNCYINEPLLEAPRFFHKQLFLKIGGFDENLIAGEDWDLANRTKKKNIKIVRTKNVILHHEAMGFIKNLKRKWYYTTHIQRYAKKHPQQFKNQSDLKQRLQFLIRNKKILLRYPLHTLSFLILKIIIFIRWKTRYL